MTTARELIEDALGDIGVLDPVETMTAEQAQHGIRTLNRIVDRMNAQRLHVYAVRDVSATFSGATATVGPGLTVDTSHPLRFETGNYYVRSGMSFPLPLWSREDYNAVVLKTQAGEYPHGVYYDRQIPGNVFLWPVPSAPLEYHFQVVAKLSEFADLDTDYSFPDGYRDLFFYSLCERLPRAYNLPVDPGAAAEAAKARAAVRKNNTNVPVLDAAKLGPARLNILTNQFQ